MQTEELSKQELLSEIKNLRLDIEELKEEKADLEIMLESIAEHSSEVNNQLHDKNQEMVVYIQNVQRLAAAISEIENNSFELDSVKEFVNREDELGKMARFFIKISSSPVAS